jgi:hypothetical protein
VVLDAFLGHEEFSSGETLAQNRQSAPGCFPKLSDFQVAFSNNPQLWGGVQKKVGNSSHYFRLSSLITIGSAEFNLYSLLYQDGQNAGSVRPILRSYTQD